MVGAGISMVCIHCSFESLLWDNGLAEYVHGVYCSRNVKYAGVGIIS